MGIINNKFVNSFISGGSTPALPPSHTPGEAVNTESPPEAKSLASSAAPPPRGWFIQWDRNARKIYYLEQATGRTQWVRPNMANAPVTQSTYEDGDGASILSGTTAVDTHGGKQSDGAIKWHELSEHDPRLRRSHHWIGLATQWERDQYWKAAAEKRKREGPPGPETSGQKVKRKIDGATEIMGRTTIMGFGC